jgi:hypothetical protein
VIEPWLRHRRGQGYTIVHVDGLKSARQIQAAIRRIASRSALKYVIIFGDADPAMIVDPDVRARCVPTFYAEAQINTKWGSEPHIATDNPYADLNNDHIPELAVGRISFDTIAQCRQIVAKIIAYENRAETGLWRRRVHFVAGVGGFGPLADAAIETAAKHFITEMIPAEYTASMTYGSWRSPYCPDPRSFREAVLSRLENGCLFWVYMGHGHPDRLDRLQFGESVVPILEKEDVPRVGTHMGAAIAVMLACYTGAFDQDEDCLAENLLRQPTGPVAVICGSRVTMPYGMAVLGTALMDGYFEQRQTRLGDIYLYAKRAMAADGPKQNGQRKLLDTIALTLSPAKDNLKGERTEHQLLFHLMGDPMLKLAQPDTVAIECPKYVDTGKTLRVAGSTPVGGRCVIELVCRRDRLTFAPPRRLQFDTDATALREMTEVYARANDCRWTGRGLDLPQGRFSVALEVPEHAEGSSFVRVFVQNESGYAMGSAPVQVRRPKPSDHLRTPKAQR